jgi:hypothetical protein
MTALNQAFVDQAQREPTEVDHGDHVVRFAASQMDGALLDVTVADVLVGYITPFNDEEYGAAPLADFGVQKPRTFRTIEGALEQLIPGAADGFETPVLQG